MENIPTNEPTSKLSTKVKTWTKRVIVLGMIYGLYWLFAPLLGVKLDIYWDKMNLGEHKTMKDVYYVNIGGITYAKDKFYVLLNKPYLFDIGRGYIYSSKNLDSWQEEISLNQLPGSMTSIYYEVDRYYVDSNGYTIFKQDHSDRSNFPLPRFVGNDCYIVMWDKGLVSPRCEEKWSQFNYLSEQELKDFNKSVINLKGENLMEQICKYTINQLPQNRITLLQKYLCLPLLPNQNTKSYKILHEIIIKNQLDILLDGSHTTYGSGKYVGIFYKNKQYYFIISTDGIHYEIKSAPSELVSSLAIKLFN